MKTKAFQLIIFTAVSTVLAMPAYARGGGFGGFRGGGGGGFGGFHSGGGGGFGGFHSGGSGGFGGFHGASGGGGREFSGGGFGGGQSSHDFGGGFNSMGGGGSHNFGGGGQGFDRGNFGGGGQGFDRGNFGGGGQGFGNRGGAGNHPDQPISNHPNFADGFGGISGNQNRTPHNISQNNLSNQGNSIRNSFNNNNISHNNQFNNTNNYNVNRYGGYGGYGHPYGGYGSGYAHGWANSNAYHGYWGAPGCWGYPGWSEAGMWTCMGLSSLTAFLGMGMMGAAMSGGSNKNSAPSSTTNVTYQGDTVYVNGQPYGSSAQYYQQAQTLAAQAYAQGQSDAYANQQNSASYPPLAPQIVSQSGGAAQSSDWAPLGVFALAEPGQSQSNMMLQLAINKQGVLRGNYLNQLTNERSQVYGSLDKTTQRVSWTIGQNNTTVFDSTLGDLTKDDSQVLVHYGPDNTTTMAMIRLPAPADAGQGAPSDASASPAPGA